MESPTFARAAITKCHRLDLLFNFLKQWKVLFLQFQRFEVWDQAVVRSGALGAQRERAVPGLSPWLVVSCLLLVSSHHLPSSCSLSFLKLHLLFMLLQLSQVLPLCPASPSPLYSLRQFPHPCSCPWVRNICYLATIFPMLYFTSPWLFCNYLFILLNPFTFFTYPLNTLPIWQS